MFEFLVTGLGLGLAAGVAPGPLLALLTTQTLRYGTREGVKVALAPPLTDAPIVAACVLLLARWEVRERLLGVVALAGSAYLAYLAWESLRARGATPPQLSAQPGSIRKALVTNLLNPHVYIFWIAAGTPLIHRAWQQAPAAAAAFLAAFYGCLVGAKLVLAVLLGRSRMFLQGTGYAAALRASGVLLLGVALWLARDGWRLLQG